MLFLSNDRPCHSSGLPLWNLVVGSVCPVDEESKTCILLANYLLFTCSRAGVKRIASNRDMWYLGGRFHASSAWVQVQGDWCVKAGHLTIDGVLPLS
jgi:hypothetical protein